MILVLIDCVHLGTTDTMPIKISLDHNEAIKIKFIKKIIYQAKNINIDDFYLTTKYDEILDDERIIMNGEIANLKAISNYYQSLTLTNEMVNIIKNTDEKITFENNIKNNSRNKRKIMLSLSPYYNNPTPTIISKRHTSNKKEAELLINFHQNGKTKS